MLAIATSDTRFSTSRLLPDLLQVLVLLVAMVSAVLTGGEVMGLKASGGGVLVTAATLVEANNGEDMEQMGQTT
ncbi:hypothetical protein [uncultured Oxalicibacterium sp.]|uniref:hypothetical protein n=1 Tax=uncultured Oxalicibacterium sp. TaxID=1168540 RepID=UPI0025FDA1D4|nr:hypothetical protein [uncultured Oxalicibacterium sp.]